MRVAGLRGENVTIQTPDSISNTYKILSKYLKGYKILRIEQYDRKHLSQASFVIFGEKAETRQITADMIGLRTKLQADALRLIPVFENLTVLNLSTELIYENIPSGDSFILKETIGKLTKLKKWDFVNTAVSNIQTGAPLNDLSVVLEQLKTLEKLSVRINLYDSEANVVRKLVTSIQCLGNLEILELYVTIINKQFYNKSFQVNTVNLPKLKKFIATASNLPEERLVLSCIKNFRSLIWLDLGISIANRDSYRSLVSSIQVNRDLEVLKLVFKFGMSIPGTEDLAEVLEHHKNLRQFQLKCYGKQYPPARGLKRILIMFQSLKHLESFEFSSTKEFEIPAQSFQEIMALTSMLKGLKELVIEFKLTENVEDKQALLKNLLENLEFLKKISIEIKGLKMNQNYRHQLERYCIERNMEGFSLNSTPSFIYEW